VPKLSFFLGGGGGGGGGRCASACTVNSKYWEKVVAKASVIWTSLKS
jgi:hypothetical protein